MLSQSHPNADLFKSYCCATPTQLGNRAGVRIGRSHLHSWAGWGSVPHRNAFLTNLEMHRMGRFCDPRLDDTAQFPIATAHAFARSIYPVAADRGDEVFSGKAKCNSCHVEPLWSDPGWNLHTPAEVCIDSFQPDRAPGHRYRTSPIGDLFTQLKGGSIMAAVSEI
jgi:hypothetical protein